MVILIREFTSPDEEMKKIVLKVSGQSAINNMLLRSDHATLAIFFSRP